MSNPAMPPRFQFSLRWLLVAITVVAVGLGLLAISDELFAYILSIITVWLLPVPLVIVACFGHGRRQTFAIGAIIPLLVSLLSDSLGRLFFGYGEFGASLGILVLSGIGGLTALATRRWLDRDTHGN